MALKKAVLILILVVTFFAVIVAVICSMQVADLLFESDQNPRSHIRNGLYMVGVYDQTYGLGTVGCAEVVAVDLRSDDKKEWLVARISRRYGGVSSIKFIDSTTIAIDISNGREVIKFDLSFNIVPINRE